MKGISTTLKAHLAQAYQTTCSCWLVVLTNGAVLGFNDHDESLTFNLETALAARSLYVPSQISGTGSVTYGAIDGYTATDIQTKSDLSVDNLELHGVLVSPSITEDDLHAGLWDFAYVVHFMVNWADLTMGCLVLRCGTIGQVSLERGLFKAELRGLLQAYSRTLGEVTQPSCRAQLFDARCKVASGPFTVTGAVTGVNVDGVTIYDTSRAEAGPTGGIAITLVSNANPGQVTLASVGTFFNGQAVAISGVVGPAVLNTITIIRNFQSSGPKFDLGIDTTNTSAYPAYVSGGTVTPLGSDSGYFDQGVITWTSGLNIGLRMDVMSYVPGQFQLWLPMPYAVQVGDTYSMVAGCDKSLATCKAKFSNVVNMRAEPYLPGNDKIVQIGNGQ